jgi:hypothetical protein
MCPSPPCLQIFAGLGLLFAIAADLKASKLSVTPTVRDKVTPLFLNLESSPHVVVQQV